MAALHLSMGKTKSEATSLCMSYRRTQRWQRQFHHWQSRREVTAPHLFMVLVESLVKQDVGALNKQRLQAQLDEVEERLLCRP